MKASNMEMATYTFNQWKETDTTRVVAPESMWKEPLKWDRLAKEAGERHSVLCASLADVFDDWQGRMVNSNQEPVEWYMDSWRNFCGSNDNYLKMQDVRDRLFYLIDRTPNLDWILLTNFPENASKMTPPAVTNMRLIAESKKQGTWMGECCRENVKIVTRASDTNKKGV